MTDLLIIAAILTGSQKEGSTKDKVNRYFEVLKELEQQAQEQNHPSMRNLINKVND